MSVFDRILRRLAAMLAVLVIALPSLPAATVPADAQQLIRRCNGLFDCLFGPDRPVETRQPPPQQQRQRRMSTPHMRQPASPAESRGGGTAAPARHRPEAVAAPPPEPAVEKLDNARVVLVVGDFLGAGLAEGLVAAYAESPGVRVVDRTNGSSGLVRDDFYDWNAEIGSILEAEKPAVVVVMIGSNDRQRLRVGGDSVEPRSDAWTREYVRRVEAFAAAMKAHDLPFIWTGLPPFKSPSMSSDMLAFNDIYKQTTEAAGGTFVDIWDGFVDENGNFVFTGPDMNGQPVRLRGSDGINLTLPAKRKVAFYVEKPLNKTLGGAVSPDVTGTGIDSLPDLVLPRPGPRTTDRTPPMSFADPGLDGGTELLGGSPATATREPETAARRLVTEGIAPTPPPGRADDFSLTPAAEPADGSATTTATDR